MRDVLADFYDGSKYGINHPKYNPPKVFEHWESTLVGEFPAEEGSDGQSCKVYESRTPSQFYDLIVNDFRIGAGSEDGMGELLFKLAEKIASGQCGVYKFTE